MAKTADMYQGELFCVMDNPQLEQKDDSQELANLLAENMRLKRYVMALEDKVSQLQDELDELQYATAI